MSFSRPSYFLQDAEKVSVLTRPTPVRQGAPFTRRRSRIVQTLNVPKRTLRLFARCSLAWEKARPGVPGLGG